jgi:tetratricopeptide (TPR) repeat protein
VKTLLLVLIAGVAAAQRAKPVFDPETKDGLLIQHLQQETEPAEKLHYLEQFAAQYPSHQAIAWVYDQLQPEYLRLKEYEQAIRIGTLRIAIDPGNLEAATIALRAADARRDPHRNVEQMVKWSESVYRLASAQAAHGGASAEVKQTIEYAEFCLYSTALETPDPKVRLDLLQKIEQEMPTSRYAQHLPALYFRTYRQMAEDEKAMEMAEKGLKSEPDNFEMLMFLTEYHFRKENPRERQLVTGYATRLIEILGRKERPEAVTEQDWEKSKAEMLGMANFMGGMSYSFLNNFAKADIMLRAALPSIRDNESRQAALFYHLGMANYRLAESGGERSRPVDALKFMRRCATIRSPYQDQAQKNVEGIKAEYNLP